jgi:hypothetical protein
MKPVQDEVLFWYLTNPPDGGDRRRRYIQPMIARMRVIATYRGLPWPYCDVCQGRDWRRMKPPIKGTANEYRPWRFL